MEDKSKLIPCLYAYFWGFPGVSFSKKSACNVGDSGSGRSPGGGNGNPLQYLCLENSTDRGAWWATVHGVAKRIRHDRSALAQHTFTSGLPSLPACPPLIQSLSASHSDLRFCSVALTACPAPSGEPSWRPFFCAHSLNKCC